MRIRSRLAAAIFAAVCAGGCFAQTPVDVVEFYNASLDHYFISSLAADIQALDSGKFAGWARTGLGFKAYDGPAAGTSPVCRFYIPAAFGDSHFYSASPAECADVRTKFPAFYYESPAVMYVGLPQAATGACAGGYVPVYRLWNKRADTNHRYTTDRDVRAAMIAEGYVPEGYGADGVAMCAPTVASGFDVTLTTESVLLLPGGSRDIYVTIVPRGGFTGAVNITASGLPPDVSQQLSFATLSVGPASASTLLRLAAAASAQPIGSDATVTISAADGGGNNVSVTLSLRIAASGDPVARRTAAIAAVEQKAIELSGQNLARDAYVQAVAAFMATRPEYVKSGVDMETFSAWGHFSDGSGHIVAANRDAVPDASAATHEDPVAKKAQLPLTTTARLLHTFGRNFEGQAPIDRMRSYLSAKGWSVRSGAEGLVHVNTLKGVSGDGYFYINTHAGREEADGEPDGKIYAIWSSVVVGAYWESVFDDDLTSARLVRMTASNGTIREPGNPVRTDLETRYSITYRFVEKYMQFPGGSVVFLNACWSGKNQKFVQAFLNKGAGVYLGWTDLISSVAGYSVPPYFVDRMLGANMTEPMESPPQRPFSYDLVLRDLRNKGADSDRITHSQLVSFANPNLLAPPIFAPSIRYVQVNEFDATMKLFGDFGIVGSDRPKVTVGGIEIPLDYWSIDEIGVQHLPLAGPGSSGDVIVEIEGVKSNARQLTEWTLPLKYLWSNPFDRTGQKFEGSGSLRFRLDVAGYRLAAGDSVQYDLPLRGGAPTRDSALPVTGSGSYFDGSCTESLSGFGNFVSPAANDTNPPQVLASAIKLGGDSKRGALGLAFGFMAPPYTTTFTGLNCPPPQPTPVTLGLLDGSADFPGFAGAVGGNPAPLPLPAIPFQASDSFAIPGVSKAYKDMGGTLTVSWTAATANNPPRDTVDAGK